MSVLAHTDASVATPADLPADLEWVPAVVPGGVHESLLAAGLVPHPYVDEHEDDVRWVEDRTWWYRFDLTGPASVENGQRVRLVLPSVDTVATAWFNGELVGSHANAFRPFVVDVTSLVRETNELVVRIAHPLDGLAQPAEPQRVLDSLKDYVAPVFDPSRPQLDEPLGLLACDSRVTLRRKPTFSWGWDFGLRLPSVGVLEAPHLLVQTTAALVGAHVRAVAVDAARAEVAIDVEADAFATDVPLRAEVVLTSPDGRRTTATLELAPDNGRGSAVVTVPDPQLWWTHDLGDQPLYDVTVELRDGGAVLDGQAFRVGLRTVELDRSPDEGEDGRRFRFLLNGVPVFARGTNWLPMSMLRGSVAPTQVRDLIGLARDGGQNMLRIWGGGAYEQDAFYETCDELGVLVWQDFMFACFAYPSEDPGLQQEVAREAAHQVSRLRNHASLALWCGNNEVEVVTGGMTGQPHLGPGDWGWQLFHAVLPAAVERNSPGAIYWPGSPWGQDDPAGVNGSLDGDRHFWEVWHGSDAPPGTPPGEAMHWKRYLEDEGKFTSEFGIQALPELSTLQRWTTVDLDLDSTVFKRRIKDVPKSKGRRLIQHEIGLTSSLAEYVDYSMACQAEGLKFGVEHYRRRQPHCNGALVWQLNDVWPGVSWSVVDFDLVPKAGYWFLQRAYAPVVATFSRTAEGVELWVSNSGKEAVAVTLTAEVVGFDGKSHVEHTVEHLAAPGSSAPVWSTTEVAEDRVAWVSDPTGRVPSNRLFFAQLKDLPLSEGALHAEVAETGAGRATVRLRAQGYTYFARVAADRPGVRFSQNYLDLCDGEEAVIEVSGLPADATASSVLTAMSWAARTHPWR